MDDKRYTALDDKRLRKGKEEERGTLAVYQMDEGQSRHERDPVRPNGRMHCLR